MAIKEKSFGTLKDGRAAKKFALVNKNGIRIVVTDVGCSIVSIDVPDKSGGTRDVAFGFNNAEMYYINPAFFGCVAGRVANRIGCGSFELDGKKYSLEQNDGGKHHLHGGTDGFNKKIWKTEATGDTFVSFTYESPDGESGYPGKLSSRITYSLTDGNVFRIDYENTTDSKTICNLTNHSYFNLDGHAAKDIYSHEMQILADRITSVDGNLIPTGELADVAGTPFDFRSPKPLGKDIEAAGGYDNNFVLNENGTAARVYSPSSGITMEVRTDSPGIQLYTGNFLNGSIQGKDGAYYHKQSGFCLETQFFPDAVNHKEFPSIELSDGKPQKHYTEFIFGVK